jgi:hypothetical protein
VEFVGTPEDRPGVRLNKWGAYDPI